MSAFKTLKLFDYSILASDISFLQIGSKCMINTINQYSYIIAEKDPQFKKALMESDVLLPDGIGILVAARVLKNKKIKKVAGADLHQYLLEQLQSKSGRCFYLGSSEKTLGEIKKRLDEEFPSVKAGFYSPPYKPTFGEDDNLQMLKAVNSFKPDVLFIGMTAPKQEKWSAEHKHKLDANVICSIGAVFDFYAGTVKRPGGIWVKLGLEWFMRLLKEPKRLKKRYIYYGPSFLYVILKQKVNDIFSSKTAVID